MAIVNDVISTAKKEIGIKESPPNSNHVKYNTWYYGRDVSGSAYPWCMVFVQWVFNKVGVINLLPIRTASCSALMNAAKKKNQWVTSNYKPGDVVIYDFQRDGKVDHVGIIESVSKDRHTVVAIEGNTSISGSQSNGGMVCRKSRNKNVIVGALRPKYDTLEDDDLNIDKLTDAEILKLADRMQDALSKRAVSSTLAAELAEAKAKGITDGTKPGAFCTRAQAAVMNLRASKIK